MALVQYDDDRQLSLFSWLGNRVFQGIDDHLPMLTMRMFIGILIAITGNVLISLALNLQKLAHKRVEEMKNASKNENQSETGQDANHAIVEANGQETVEDLFSEGPIAPREAELQPLVAHGEVLVQDYGSQAPLTETPGSPKRTFASRFNPMRARQKKISKFLLPVDVISEDAALHGLSTIRRKPSTSQGDDNLDAVEENEGEYLKSKLWWTGFLLMNIGETGNFISYAFAPASMVAPLGTFALMANCFFAPLLLGEHFKKRDLFGVLIAVVGAVTVVLASNASETRLDVHALLRAISQIPFIIYSCVYVAGALTLATLSEGEVGKNFVFVDVGLCALFGGFTVLSTKALSTLLTLQWLEIFTYWITYILIVVLLLTGVGQIRYLNRALMRFDSKVVIPIQFVFFTLSVIIGSAILYGDFKRASFHEIVTFLYGCAATFAGVFIIAWSPKDSTDDLEGGEEDTEQAVIPDPIEAGQEGAYLGMGTMGRRRRATLVLPSGVNAPKDAPPLRHKRSGITTMGISPAQHLLLVHTPPRDISLRDRFEDDVDLEHGSQTPVGSYRRRRTASWYGSTRGSRTRDSSTVGRLRPAAGGSTAPTSPQ